MVGGNPIWWELNNMRPAPTDTSSLFPSSSLPLPQYHDNQELPESWSQLLMGGLVEEEERCSYSTPFQTKKMESWEDDQMLYLNEEIIHAARSYWSSNQILQNSSPSSCVTTTSLNSSMLEFSDNKAQTSHQRLDHSSVCNSTTTGSSCKKPRVQASTAQSTFKVRKEKLGDRITALHQLVSPFGKTDTASVLLEAIGYIRFLQSQIEALSSPYLGSTGTGGNIKQSAGQGERSCIFPEDPGQLLNDNCMKRRGPPDQDGVDESKDLRSRGLCLVPVSFTMHVGNDNAADYWAPAFGGGFQ